MPIAMKIKLPYHWPQDSSKLLGILLSEQPTSVLKQMDKSGLLWANLVRVLNTASLPVLQKEVDLNLFYSFEMHTQPCKDNSFTNRLDDTTRRLLQSHTPNSRMVVSQFAENDGDGEKVFVSQSTQGTYFQWLCCKLCL